MIKYFLMLGLAVIASLSSAQNPASVYLKELPLPPGNVCENDCTRVYDQQLSRVISALGKDLAARKKEVNDLMKSNKEQAREKMMKNSGMNLTPEQMEQMKQGSKNMTQEQKMKLANELMQKNANISMEEAMARKEDSQNKDTAALKGWAMAYATENMADQPADNTKAAAKQLEMKNMADLTREMSDLQTRLMKEGSKYTILLDSLQSNADAEWFRLLKRIEPFQAEIDSIYAARKRDPERQHDEEQSKRDGERIDNLQTNIHELKFKYCPVLTQRYVDVLNGLYVYLPKTFAIHDRVDELNSEIVFRQTGIRMPPAATGISALQAVSDYASMLGKTQKYRLVPHRETDNKSEIGIEP
ncbi:MAG: hypothetical protein WAV93_00115 [Bacteroidales bacterium]